MLICREDTEHCTTDCLTKNGLKQVVPDVKENTF